MLEKYKAMAAIDGFLSLFNVVWAFLFIFMQNNSSLDLNKTILIYFIWSLVYAFSTLMLLLIPPAGYAISLSIGFLVFVLGIFTMSLLSIPFWLNIAKILLYFGMH